MPHTSSHVALICLAYKAEKCIIICRSWASLMQKFHDEPAMQQPFASPKQASARDFSVRKHCIDARDIPSRFSAET